MTRKSRAKTYVLYCEEYANYYLGPTELPVDRYVYYYWERSANKAQGLSYREAQRLRKSVAAAWPQFTFRVMAR